jgi:hypothetical protein
VSSTIDEWSSWHLGRRSLVLTRLRNGWGYFLHADSPEAVCAAKRFEQPTKTIRNRNKVARGSDRQNVVARLGAHALSHALLGAFAVAGPRTGKQLCIVAEPVKNRRG